MSDYQRTVVKDLVARFNGEESEFRDDVRLTIAGDDIIAASTKLRDEFGFEMLADLTAVDYWPETDPRFNVVYRFRSIKHNIDLQIRVPVPAEKPELPTLEGIYPNANWYEREIWDMFGIHFDGHSNLRRILMPHDWQGHPLRKDYPLGYEEIQFSFNFDEIDSGKPYAKE